MIPVSFILGGVFVIGIFIWSLLSDDDGRSR